MENKKNENDKNYLGLSDELQKKFDDLLFAFGLNMHAGRKKWKLKQEDLAEALGLKGTSGRNQISRIENGERNLKLPFMIRVADIFDMELKIEWVHKKKQEPRKSAAGKDESANAHAVMQDAATVSPAAATVETKLKNETLNSQNEEKQISTAGLEE